MIQTHQTTVRKDGAIMPYFKGQSDIYGTDGVSVILGESGTFLIAKKLKADMSNEFVQSDWEELEFGGSGGALTKVIYKDASFDVDKDSVSSLFVVDTTSADLTATLTASDYEDSSEISFVAKGDNILNIVAESGWTIDLAGASLVKNERVTFVLDLANQVWQIKAIEKNPIVGDVTHLVGFYTEGLFIYVDIIPVVAGVEIDTLKYNMFFEDGSASWLMTDTSVTVENVQDIGLVETIE